MHLRTTILCRLMLTVLCLPPLALQGQESDSAYVQRDQQIQRIEKYYADQLVNPVKRKHNTLAPFGYHTTRFPASLFASSHLINPTDLGKHAYGSSLRGENNGSLYTCKGGFIDFSKMRSAADYTVYIACKIIAGNADFELAHEYGTLRLYFQNTDDLSWKTSFHYHKK